MRQPIIVGNWKMNMVISASSKLIEELLDTSDFRGSFDLVVAPPFTSLSVVNNSIKGSNIKLAGQNMASKLEGAQTGEVSATMLKDAGCDYVILGHSERRQHQDESDELINKKVFIACENALNAIFCIGESFDDQKKGKTYEVLEGQLLAGLKGLNEEQLNSLLIAYEPIWAIGSGHTAGANKVQEVHSFIRNWLKNSFGKNFAERARIIYGGSVDSKISSSLMEQPDVDGLLVGGASLKSKSFYDIIKLSFETGD